MLQLLVLTAHQSLMSKPHCSWHQPHPCIQNTENNTRTEKEVLPCWPTLIVPENAVWFAVGKKRHQQFCPAVNWEKFWATMSTYQATCTDLCNSGMMLLETTNHFMIRYEAHVTGRNRAWSCKCDQESMARLVIDCIGEPTVVVLLNRHGELPP